MSDKRQELRLSAEDVVVFVELEGIQDAGGARRELLCAALDISANGIRILLDRPLPQSAIHMLRVRLPKEQREFNLVAEIAWCDELPSGEVIAGLSLFESLGSDIADWKEAVHTEI